MPTAQSPFGPALDAWRPEPVTTEDPLPPGPVEAVSALLDLPEPAAATGGPLPPLWQWFYFLHWPAQRALSADGHPHDERFLPPVPDRQRMFAGGRCEFVEPLRLGRPATCVGSLGAVTPKRGRTGEMLFVTERREYRQDGRRCLVEEQDYVYRSGRTADPGLPTTLDARGAPTAEDPWQLPLQPDPTLLFRFSALTANTHRIHYDAPYCRAAEGYPGLVVHGPLLALLMLELVRRNAPERRVRALAYRLRRPVFAGERLLAAGTASGGRAGLRIATHRETGHATGEVTFD
ncbi:MaoC/PaaZ C-terminal domain-containing protein [Streptomyces sp. NPDC056149]|uniref:MaoC/PaaZ C-terminal domain-containing protein n=1 Tax=unclassified Streptomyces TaxID=2593676 RepID=UPI0023813CD0|nr:MaoC/PaaZ C-terminal domain-containing protein [Streptomyces sp. WZ-12]